MTTPGIAAPRGRAGRLLLVRRLATARRGADLLDRKLRILQAELSRLQAAQEQTAADWAKAQAEAQTWLLRLVLLGGQRAVRLAADAPAALVSVSYASAMGIRYPGTAACTAPPSTALDSPVVASTRQAHADALAAAARHGAAAQAVQTVGAEVTATRYRLRAVRDRWIPRLEQSLAEVTFAIEEQERADAARLRLAARRAT